MTVVGIDPGLSGGIAWTDGERAGAIVMPILAGRPNLAVLSSILDERRPRLVVIEEPQIRPGESGTSALTIGINWGLVVGLLTERGVPWQEVRPDAWKQRMGLTTATPKRKGEEQTEEVKKARLARAKAERKEAAIAMAIRLFPAVPLKASARCKNYHDGMAEALLIAEYGRREQGGLFR